MKLTMGDMAKSVPISDVVVALDVLREAVEGDDVLLYLRVSTGQEIAPEQVRDYFIDRIHEFEMDILGRLT